MKKLKLLLVLPFLLWGCAGTEDYSTTDTTANQQAEATAAETVTVAAPDTANQEAATTVSAENPVGGELNIVALAQYNPNLSTFFRMIREADLTVQLESPGNFTVFAPTNEAFAALPAGTLEILSDPVNKAELTRIIRSHIIEDKFLAAELRDKDDLITAIGKPIEVTVKNGVIIVGAASIIKEDVDASNGVIHVINKVLIPPKDQ